MTRRATDGEGGSVSSSNCESDRGEMDREVHTQLRCGREEGVILAENNTGAQVAKGHLVIDVVH